MEVALRKWPGSAGLDHTLGPGDQGPSPAPASSPLPRLHWKKKNLRKLSGAAHANRVQGMI